MTERAEEPTAAELDALSEAEVITCPESDDGFWCTRTRGHEGEHIAAGFSEIVHRWGVRA